LSNSGDTRKAAYEHPASTVVAVNELRVTSPRIRDRVYAAVTMLIAVLVLPVTFLCRRGRGRELACSWALHLRFPSEDLTGLTEGARAAFSAARAEAFWRHGQIIGLTSGYRDPSVQQRLYDEEVRRSGSPASARLLVLPPNESSHVKGIALDIRPREGARWLEEHGARYHLYRTYDNEWWHFEHRPDDNRPPMRLPHPGATVGHRHRPATAAIGTSSRLAGR
jgi:D-alanyl-D-alanine carboxypeptidase